MQNISEETAKHTDIGMKVTIAASVRVCPHGTGDNGIAENAVLTWEGKEESEEQLERERIEDAPPPPEFGTIRLVGFCTLMWACWVAETSVPTHCDAFLE